MKDLSGKNRTIVLMDNKLLRFGLISGCLLEDFPIISQKQKEINNYCDKMPNIPYMPK